MDVEGSGRGLLLRILLLKTEGRYSERDFKSEPSLHETQTRHCLPGVGCEVVDWINLDQNRGLL